MGPDPDKRESMLSGRVIEEQKNYYVIDTPRGPVRAAVKGSLKKKRQRVCAGDVVDVELINDDALDGVILRVHDRTSYLNRPALANLSQVVFVNTYREPPLDLEAIDRFLFSAQAYSVSALLVFNKADLLDSNDGDELRIIERTYETIGYRTLHTSAVKQVGIAELVAACEGELTAFAGLSGVGKSTLLSAIFPDRNFRISEVSGSTGRGTHTTTNVNLLPLGSGYVADTPGFSFVDIPTVPEEDVIGYFPELSAVLGKCRFNNCLHDEEPGCVVRELVERGHIAAWRHEHYLKIYREMIERRKRAWKPPRSSAPR